MLKKLLKYDLQHQFKFLAVFYALALFFAVLARGFLSADNSLAMTVIGEICRGVAISMMFNIIINNLMRLWVRFKGNFYGDEAYLTHTLPVEKHTLYASKIITAVITVLASMAVIGLTLLIAYYSLDIWEWLKMSLLPMADIYDSSIAALLAALFGVLFLEFSVALQCGFTGIILGHRHNHAKTGYSVLWGFAAYMLTQTIVLSVVFLVALFDADWMQLFISNEISDISMLKGMLYLIMGAYTVLFCVTAAVNVRLFKKGVNVD